MTKLDALMHRESPVVDDNQQYLGYVIFYHLGYEISILKTSIKFIGGTAPDHYRAIFMVAVVFFTNFFSW